MKAISGKKLASLLEKKGWILVDIKGSHFKYCKDNKTVVIPIHGNRDLRIGTLLAVLKQTGLSKNDLD